jgi:hypothetical protein
MHHAWLARFDGDDGIRGELTEGRQRATAAVQGRREGRWRREAACLGCLGRADECPGERTETARQPQLATMETTVELDDGGVFW